MDPVEPSITALEIDQGRYVERAHVIGDATFTVSMPFPVELSTRGLHPA